MQGSLTSFSPLLPTADAPPHKNAAQFLLINLVLPLLLYYVSIPFATELHAILLSALPPALETLYHIVAFRCLDPISALQVLATVLALAVLFVTNEPKVLLVKDSFTTMTIGVGFLLSLQSESENLVWHYVRGFYGSTDAKRASLATYWRHPEVQAVSARVCRVWGVALLLEASLRVTCIGLFSISSIVLLSPLLALVFALLVLLWTRSYVDQCNLPALDPPTVSIYQAI
ncbi:hypothetical protein SPRG_09216 [Saprolegnia parasitica CBS 223.65]|uniref:Uncharacterized protein n=1 Tax=Saprolegnia parasitica (strain CBS 223.65) TaxID=695850 RepID=A0A067CEU7_SAPPC|nr:hypothetical protein SPRG_09216 [Saprolegnia parasitica CBS 223.65]KDO25076.1 hypothetical protein SPRG_09216 [Saprolegnia parasitica CBS 223.65]|eukprot:XP_012204150.1 hypothetical protein SPRG_09216 [Saprolegnia parasitica CBS 223.65]